MNSGNGSRSGPFVFMTDSEIHAPSPVSPTQPPSPPAPETQHYHHDKHLPDTLVTTVHHSALPYHQSSTAGTGGGTYPVPWSYWHTRSLPSASVSSGFTARSTAVESTSENTAVSVPTTRTTQQDGFSWRCQSCGRDPCDDPTAASCGHIFCFTYVIRTVDSIRRVF